MAGDASKEAQARRLKLARERAGIKDATAGWEFVRAQTKAPLSKTTYLQHENGTRSLKGQARRYGAAFGVDPSWLVWGEEPSEQLSTLSNVKLAVKPLGVRYRVQAGLWREVDADVPIRQIETAVSPLSRFPAEEQWLEEVVGDSANLKIQPGMLAHVVNAIAIHYTPQEGHWVVVERCRGPTRERTIKQIAFRGNTIELWPRSTNPRWQEPIRVTEGAREGDDVEVQIVGLVVGAYDPDFL